MTNYDAWLEKPYQDRYAKDAAYEAFEEYCEEMGLDPEQEDFEQWLDDEREDREVEAAEMAREAYYDDY